MGYWVFSFSDIREKDTLALCRNLIGWLLMGGRRSQLVNRLVNGLALRCVSLMLCYVRSVNQAIGCAKVLWLCFDFLYAKLFIVLLCHRYTHMTCRYSWTCNCKLYCNYLHVDTSQACNFVGVVCRCTQVVYLYCLVDYVLIWPHRRQAYRCIVWHAILTVCKYSNNYYWTSPTLCRDQ